MLVVLSDLHFVDATAGDHNVNCEAFHMLYEDIVAMARNAGAKRIDLLFLGDIFDLIRTEHWLGVKEADRPWGDAKINSHPLEINPRLVAETESVLTAILEKTRKHCDMLSGRDPRAAALIEKAEIEVRRHFIPGNHDRLYVAAPQLRAAVHGALGVDPRGLDGLDLRALRSEEYGVVARHGHEFDLWNFEGYAKDPEQQAGDFLFAEEDYRRVPIGDPITTELVVALPLEVRKRMTEEGFAEEVVRGAYDRLQQIENVRPVTASIAWVRGEVGAIESGEAKLAGAALSPRERRKLSEIIRGATHDVFKRFMRLPFVEHWIEQRDRFTWRLDEADKLQWLSRLGSFFVSAPEVLERLESFFATTEDPQRKYAFREPLLMTNKFHYAVYGHTHKFEQIALRSVDGHEKLYLNSGTWRPRYARADSKEHWVSWKEMTYLVFFSESEDREFAEGPRVKGHSFRTWTGTLLKKRRGEAV